MTEWLGADEQVAWRDFMYGVHRVLEQLDQTLQESHGIRLTDYEILVFLSEATGRRLRMSELADSVLVSRSRLTYRVDRLVEQGYVTRSEASDDRRGLYAQLTDEGLELLMQAAQTHVDDVRTHLMNHIDPDDFAGFARTWKAIADFVG